MSDESTPVSTPPEVRREVLRSRASSQHSVHLAHLAAMEILRTTVALDYRPEDEDALVETLADTIGRYMRDHAAQHCAASATSMTCRPNAWTCA